MVQIISSLIGLAVAFPLLVSAAPSPFVYPRDIPAGATHLALDEGKGQIVAFDASGKSLGTFAISKSPTKRDSGPGSCNPLDLTDAKKCSYIGKTHFLALVEARRVLNYLFISDGME